MEARRTSSSDPALPESLVRTEICLAVGEATPLARNVRLGSVGVDGLCRGQGVAQVRLGSGVLGPLAGAEEGRDGDADEDGDDHHHDHELDQCEAAFAVVALPGSQAALDRLDHCFPFRW